MLFNKKNNPEVAEATDLRFNMAFSAQAGNAFLKILRKELSDFEKQKIDIVDHISVLPLVSEESQAYYNDLITIRSRATEVDNLIKSVEKFARKDEETGLLITTMSPGSYGSLVTSVNSYKQKRMKDLLVIRDDVALANDSFEETSKRINDLNRSLQYVAEAEVIINQYANNIHFS